METSPQNLIRRRFGLLLFCVVWGIVLIVPSLRIMWRLQSQEATSPSSAVGESSASWGKLSSDELSQLLAHYPNDVRVLGKVVEWRRFTSGSPQVFEYRSMMREYDAILQRFPNTPWLLANRLRFSDMWLVLSRDAGDFTRLPRGYQVVPEYQRRHLYTTLDVNQAIAAAQRGRRLDPGNSFFDWMLAQFLFMAYRDDEALEVLHEGAGKPRYDDYTGMDAQVALEVRKLVRHQLFEDKYVTAASVLFPHLSQHRNTTRLAVWQAVEAERAGDHQKALQIYGDVARLGGRMAKNDRSLITALVGVAVTAIAWGGADRRLPSPAVMVPNTPANENRAMDFMADRFARYASAHGHPELAAETGPLNDYVRGLKRQSKAQLGLAGFDRGSAYVRGLWWIGTALLTQLPILLGLWLILTLSLQRTETPAVSRVNSVSTAFFVTAITAGIAASALVLGVGLFGWTITASNGFDSGFDPSVFIRLRYALVSSPVVVSALLSFIAISWRYRAAGPGTPSGFALPSGTTEPLILPYAGGAHPQRHTAPALFDHVRNWSLTLATITAWLILPFIPSGPQSSSSQYLCLFSALLLSALCFLRWVIRMKRSASGPRLSLKLGSTALTGATLLAWLLTFTLPEGPRDIYPIALLLTGLSVGRLLWQWWRLPRLARPRLVFMWKHGLCWYRDTVGAYIVGASMIYLLLLLTSLPIRQGLEQKIDTLIRDGEMATMRSSVQ